jgi:hypothetical protein
MKTLTLSALLLGGALAWTLVVAQDNPHGSLDLDCLQCHTDEAWRPLRKSLDFNHSDVGYSLDGSHRKVSCRSCHGSLEFALVPTACADCHEDIHRGEFGYRCETCHLSKSWDNRRRMWDQHAATLFPLTGAHATADCGTCHSGEAPFQYALTPVDCIDCHLDEYVNTSDPDHQTAGFPTDCLLCHGTSSWDVLRFPQHDPWFPINSGTHQGEWDSCSDCHTTPGDFTEFECTGCHAHSFDEMEEKHDGVDDYVWVSSECYSCHPRGRAEDHDGDD